MTDQTPQQPRPANPGDVGSPWQQPTAPPSPGFGAPVPQPTWQQQPGWGGAQQGYGQQPYAGQQPGFAAPYRQTQQPQYGVGFGAYPPRGRGLGVTALLIAIVTTLGATVIGGIAGYLIGSGATRELLDRGPGARFDLSLFTPVREWVFVGEVTVYAAGALWFLALVLGIVAVASRRGRRPGGHAIVWAVLGPIVFAVVTAGLLVLGRQVVLGF